MIDADAVAPHRRALPLKRLAVAAFVAVATSLLIVWGIERWQTWPLREAMLGSSRVEGPHGLRRGSDSSGKGWSL